MVERARGQNWQDIPIIEPIPIMDTFATGWVVEMNEDYVRVTCYAEHPLAFPLGDMAPLERQIVAKVVYPKRLYDKAMTAMMDAMPLVRVPALSH